jgi:arylsulfatase A-like enzyme
MKTGFVRFLLLAFFLSAMGVSTASAGEKKDIYFVVWDTTRVDHVSAYGYERETTPNLDAIAKNAAVFHNAQASGSWTPPSVASMFTGLFSRSHLVDYAPKKELMEIPEEATTMAEALRDEGYYTALFTAQSVFYKDGYTQGFMQHESVGSGHFKNRVAEVMEKAGDKPVFLVLYWLNPHSPYNPPPIHDLFTDPNGPKVNIMVKEADKKTEGDYSHSEVNSGKVVLDEAQWNQLRARYDGELHSNDQRMQNGINRYHGRRPFGDAVFVMTSDHGEMFNERSEQRVWHGWPTHENQRVPLIIKAAGQSGRVDVRSQVRGVDIFPTVMELAGVNYTGPLNGKSLVPLMNGATEADRPNIGSSHYWNGLMYFNDGKYNLITSRLNTEKTFLYDLTKDPEETTNIAKTNPELVASIKKKMEAYFEASYIDIGIKQKAKISSAEEEQLRALGYME